MKVSEYLVNYLIYKGVTDVFGIPGGVVLDLLYAFDGDSRITPHLSYHEQGAAFEACGYAQCEHRLGVAYATRGPGFTNLITGITDAYADSIPVLFITSHGGKGVGHARRFEKEQEMDTVSMVGHITKFAKTIDDVDEVCNAVQTACYEALNGRKGPVFLDFSAGLWNAEIEYNDDTHKETESIWCFPVGSIKDVLKKTKRPIILAGDGVRQAGAIKEFLLFCDKLKIPVLSSRCGQDVGAVSKNYYGYIGSHGIRYSNFILAKADVVIAIGNRFGFPLESKSFSRVLENKKIVRVDVDEKELDRSIPNTESYRCDLKALLGHLNGIDLIQGDFTAWIGVCDELKEVLWQEDRNDAIDKLVSIFSKIDENVLICSDVGNNEFWVSRAYVEAGIKNRNLYSKSFGVLGCGIPKAIGAAYATKNPVICIVGDQGFQMNLQELQMIAAERLPIAIIVINNRSSGMIRSREKMKYNGQFVHTTLESGYGFPCLEKLAEAYGIKYSKTFDSFPSIVEIDIDEEIDLEPDLPVGKECQDMMPALSREKYEELQSL